MTPVGFLHCKQKVSSIATNHGMVDEHGFRYDRRITILVKLIYIPSSIYNDSAKQHWTTAHYGCHDGITTRRHKYDA